TPQGISWLGFFYGGNIAGAVLGCLLAGFYLLRVHDMATAIYAAVIINAAVALISLGLAALSPRKVVATERETRPVSAGRGFWPVLSPGLLPCLLIRSPTGQLILTFRGALGTSSSLIWRGASGPSSQRPVSGERAFRSPWPLSQRMARTRENLSAASTLPIPW